MRYLRSTSNEPAFNLAMEEYFFGKPEEYFLLWQNNPSVIIGASQNAMAEIDYDYVNRNNITVARRISGGGAVFHDLGNVNFTYLVNDQRFGDYNGFTESLVKCLNELGCPAELTGRNDLSVKGMKFSGNAQFVRKNRMMHHGCILFDAKLDRLAAALRPDPEKIKSKGVASVRKRVCNLREFIDMDTKAFFDYLESYMIRAEGLEPYEMTQEDEAAIRQLAEEKFSSYEWVYGRSPRYTFHRKQRFTSGGIEFYLEVKDGVIASAALYGDFFSKADPSLITDALEGCTHDREAVLAALSEADADNVIAGIGITELMSCLF